MTPITARVHNIEIIVWCTLIGIGLLPLSVMRSISALPWSRFVASTIYSRMASQQHLEIIAK